MRNWFAHPAPDRPELSGRGGARYSIVLASEFGRRKTKAESEKEKSGPGWVYVLKQPKDPYFSNLYFKVGLSKKDPDERAIQLWDTAVTLPLHVKYAVFSAEKKLLETAFYEYCSDVRLTGKKTKNKKGKISDKPREFVPLDLHQIIWILNHCAERCDLATGTHLISKDAMADARRAIGPRLIGTGIESRAFSTKQNYDCISKRSREVRKKMLEEELEAFKQARKWARKVLPVAIPLALAGVCMARILGAITNLQTAGMAIVGLILAGVASLLGGSLAWHNTIRSVRSDVKKFGPELYCLIQGQHQMARRAPLQIALTGPDPRLALFQSPESRAEKDARRGNTRHKRIIAHLAAVTQRKIDRMRRTEAINGWRALTQLLSWS